MPCHRSKLIPRTPHPKHLVTWLAFASQRSSDLLSAGQQVTKENKRSHDVLSATQKMVRSCLPSPHFMDCKLKPQKAVIAADWQAMTWPTYLQLAVISRHVWSTKVTWNRKLVRGTVFVLLFFCSLKGHVFVFFYYRSSSSWTNSGTSSPSISSTKSKILVFFDKSSRPSIHPFNINDDAGAGFSHFSVN